MERQGTRAKIRLGEEGGPKTRGDANETRTEPSSNTAPPSPEEPRTRTPTTQTGPAPERAPPRDPEPTHPSRRPYGENVPSEYVEDDEITGISRLAKAVKDFGAAQQALKPGWQSDMEHVMGNVLAQQLQQSLQGGNNNSPPPESKMDFWERTSLQLAANEGTPGALAHIADSVLGFADKHLTKEQIQQGYDRISQAEEATANHQVEASEPGYGDEVNRREMQQAEAQTAEPQGQAREFDLLSINVENPEECFRVCRELGEPVTDPEAAQHLIYAMQIEEMKARGMVEEDAEPVTGTATERERSQQPQEHQRDAGREQTLDRINELERKMEMQMEKNQKLQEYTDYLEEQMQEKEEQIEKQKRKTTGLNIRPRTKAGEEVSRDEEQEETEGDYGDVEE